MIIQKPNKLGLSTETINELCARIDYQNLHGSFGDNKQVCYEWLNPFDKYNRPIFRLNGNTVLAKKLMHQLYIGPIDTGKTVANHCRNKVCVRPEHLYQAYFFLKEVPARSDCRKFKRQSRKLMEIDEYSMLMVLNAADYGTSQRLVSF